MGDLFRVVECPDTTSGCKFEYRVMHKRRVLFKCRSEDARFAIEQCMMFAFGCDVEIPWGVIL